MPARIAIALDLDGVIIESNDGKSEAFVATFAARWPDWEDRVRRYNRTHFGVPRRDKMQHLLGQIVPEQPSDALLATLLEEYRLHLASALTRFPLVDGVRELIASPSFDIILCSSAPAEEIGIVLQHHDLLSSIHRIFDGSTPKTDALRWVAAVYGENCLFVGDAAADQRAALEAGVRFVLRQSGPEAAQLDAPTVIRDFRSFQPFVEQVPTGSATETGGAD